jgi:hypothetical protein
VGQALELGGAPFGFCSSKGAAFDVDHCSFGFARRHESMNSRCLARANGG